MKVTFTPEPLLNCQKLHYMGLDVGSEEDADVIFHWNYTGTLWQARSFPDGRRVINRDTLTTAKSYVDKVFTDVYGYSSQAQGVWAVAKPEATNGFKDCHLVNNTIHHEGIFYQRPFIDCYMPESKVKEYRITIMDYRPVIVLVKYKTVTPMNLIGQVDYYEFEDDCDDMIEDFCRNYPLEYGEIDGVYADDKWWIYDVNPTPGDAAFVNMGDVGSKEYKNRYKHYLYRWLNGHEK